MAEDYYDLPINKHTDWGGDKSTNHKPVTGKQVQAFVKDTLEQKVGEMYFDTTRNRYLVFSDAENRDAYLKDPIGNANLLIGSFEAPFNYQAKITLKSPAYNAITLGSSGNYIEFSVDVENKEGYSTGENILCTYTIRRGSITTSISEQYSAGKNIRFNVDSFLDEGVNNITIAIQGTTSLAATTVAVTYQVVNLKLTTDLDISQIYDLSESEQIMSVPFSVSGYGTKVVEWYIDGVQLDFVKIEDEVVDVEVTRTKYITLANLAQGTHNLQIRAYVVIEGEKFYSDVLYREFMVYTGANQNTMFAVAMSVPSKYGVISERKLYNLVQYIPYELVFATYTPTLTASSNVVVKLNNIEQGTILSENGITNKITIASTTSGYGLIQLSADGQVYELEAEIAETTMAIEEITDQLTLSFRALGKTNNATDKDQWSYGNYVGTFNGFNWNDTSGWVDNALYINSGASFAINYAPLSNNPTQLGKTIEVEFCTTNVSDDNEIICDLRNSNGTGIVITATSVKMVSEGGMVVETSYKANEYVRFGFVINKSANTTNKCMSFIYDKGVVSRGVAWLPTDSYTSDKTILFSGSEKAEVKLKNIRIYDSALTNDQMLNNYMLYRDSVLEMNAIYERNDVYEEGTTSFNYERMMSRLPVMIVTGNIPTLESTTDKDTQIKVDIDYFNIQDPNKSFKMKNAAMRPQGTSSMGYPKKNFRIYTQKIDSTIFYDANGKVVSDKLYSFKDGAQPVNCWCLKADYAESSGTHNTGIARLWNEVLFNATINGEYVFRTEAQKKALEAEYEYDVRTTIDGFPILLFYRMTATDPLTFIGKYNFNNDKSTESVFGFEGIPNFDNSRMQCWEVLNNGNALALFTSVDGFDSNWSEAFESRYPDTKTPNTSDLKAFCTWMTNVSASDFATQKWEHLDVYLVAAYYVYLMRFGAVDQTVKNSMLTSEDGVKFYFINYDNDTINGLINIGRLLVPPYATRATIAEDGQPYYAGNESRLWNLLEQDDEFMTIVRSVDEALYSAGLRYEEVINMFDKEQAEKWVERVYNQDAQYKYISPYADSGIDNLFMLQGNRSTHRKFWLAKRFSFFDSKFITGDYKSQSIELKCINNTPSGQKFTITAGTDMDYGYGINNVPREGNITLEENDTYTFTTQEVVNLGDPIRIYTAPNIKGLDLSQMSDVLAVVTIDKVYDSALGTKFKKLIVGSATKENVGVEAISGLAMAKELEYIDVQNMKGMKALDLSQQKNIKYVDARGSNISAIELGAGAPIETLKVPSVMKALNFNQLPNLASIDAEDFSVIQSMTILKCPKLSTNNYQFLVDWAQSTTNDSELYLEMNDIVWDNISYANLVIIGGIGTKKLKGRVKLSDTSIINEQVETLTNLFGDNCLNPNSEFYIDIPEGIFIIGGADSVIEGESLQFSTQVVSNYSGSVDWSITSGGTTNQSISSNGLLTTKDVSTARTITIQAKFTPTSGSAVIATKTISVVQAIRPTSATISGASQLVGDTTYTLAINPTSGINREYSVDWTLENNDNNYVIIKSETKTNCVLALNSTSAVGSVTLKATITCDNGTKVIDTHTINLGVNLTIVLYSNQPNDDTIANLETTIMYEKVSLVAQNNSSVNVPINKEVNVVFTDIEGYRKPNDISFMTTTTDVTKSGDYETEVVNVDLIFEEGLVIPDEVQITINNKEYIWNGTTISTKVAFGVTYDVVFGNVSGLRKPNTQTYIASQVSNNISGEYISQPNELIATHNVTSTTSTTRLLGSSFNISQVSKMWIDDVEVTPVKTYTFSTTGDHTVKIRMDKTTFSSCSNMFYSCYNLTLLDLSNFDTSSVTDINRMFSFCSELTSLDVSLFDTSNVTNMEMVFQGCKKLPSIDISNWDVSNVTNANAMFSSCSVISILDFSKLNFKNLSYIKNIFDGCNSLTKVIGLENLITNKITNLSSIFNSCKKITSIDFSNCDVSNVTNLYEAFSSTSITTFDLSIFNIDKITDIKNIFEYCYELTSVVIPVFPNVTSYYRVFKGCSKLTSVTNIDKLVTNKVTNLGEMFYDCYNLTIDISNWDVSNVKYIDGVFYGNRAISSLDTSKFKVCKFYDIDSAFAKSYITSIDMSNWNLSNLISKSLYRVFEDCSQLTSIDMSGIDITKFSFNGVFQGCKNLKSLKLGSNAPNLSSGSSNIFGTSTSKYTGYNSRSTGENKLYVPIGATGYDTGYWLDPLQNPEKCGFTIEYYNPYIGVYIYDTDGNYTLPENWDSANNDKAVGVYVGTETHSFVIAKDFAELDAYGSIGSSGYIKFEDYVGDTGVNIISSYDDAILDLNGFENTQKLSSTNAASKCINYIFPNGENGYMPSIGEWVIYDQNKDAISIAMEKIGGYTHAKSSYSIHSSTISQTSGGYIDKNWRYYGNGATDAEKFYSNDGNSLLVAFSKTK